MPTYSYKCPTCGNAFDIVQSFSDDALTVCDVCGGSLRKVFSPIGVSFNGSGFYRTDSRPAPKSEGASSTSSSGSGDSGSSSGSGSKSSESGGSGSSGTSTTSTSTPAAKPASTSGASS